MNTLGPSGNTPLILKELDIPGRTGPVSSNPDVWGINIAAAQDNFPRQGLLCRAGPWSTMGRGDKLVVSWGTGNQVINATVEDHEIGTTLTKFVPTARIQDGRYKVSYAVTRFGQTAEPSEVMDVLVKLDRPGGQDTSEEPGHPSLIMTIPKDILEGGIDKDNVAAGVLITIGPDPDSAQPYPNAAAGDVIQVSWGGVFVLGAPLTQDQADGKAPVTVHVTEAHIREASDSDSSGLAVAYEVYDLVDNRSEDWSVAQRVVVAIDTSRLPAPLLKEASNNVLDVDKLGDANGTAQVVAMDESQFKVGDIIILRIKGTPTEGGPIDVEISSDPLSNVPSIPEISIPNALLRQLAKAQLALSFRLQKADGSPDLPSKTRFINVIGEVRRLQAPVALDAEQGALDPDLAQVRVEIPFDDSFLAGQAIKLFWLGTRPDLSTYLPDLPLRPISPKEIDDKKPLPITVPGAHLKPIEGGTLELYYQLLIEDAVLGTMNRANATHAIRESIHAEPLQVGEPRLELPEPKVDFVVDGVLPPDIAGTTLTVLYRNTVKDDEVFREWQGSKTGPDSDSIKLTSFTAGQEVPFPISAELIKGNEGGTVKASYSIKWADGRPTSFSNALEFSVGTVLDLTPPRLKEAPDDISLDPIAAKDALTALVNYSGMALNDEIVVTFTGAPGSPAGGSYTAPAKKVQALGVQEIALVNSVVAFNLGKAVSVSYTVKRGGNAPLPSTARQLVVLALRLDLSNVPKILQAENGGDGPTLNLAAISTATIHAPNWPLIALRQYVWLRFKGTLANGTVYDKLIWQAPTSITNPAWLTGFYEYNLTAAWLNELKGLKHGSTFSLEFKAALGGSQVEAEAQTFPLRTYTLNTVADEKPLITKAEDSKGVEIPQADITVDTTVKLTGSAAKGQQVQVRDGTTIKGEPVAHATTGIWEWTMITLSVSAHSFTAKALYGSGLESTARTLTIVAADAPTITAANGLPSGAAIANGGITVETGVKLTGSAAKGLKVDVRDATGSKGTPTAHATTGIWEQTVSALTVATHSFTAKALYGAGQESAARTLTVVANIVPELRLITDPKGVEIANNGQTVHTTVIVSGIATPGSTIDLVNAGAPIAGTEIQVNPQGNWEFSLTGLVAGTTYELRARRQGGAVSNARKVAVVALLVPTLDKVLDSAGVEIGEGGFTASTSLKLSGKASNGQQVEIFDGQGTGAASKGIATAHTTTGLWEHTITVPLGGRRLYAQSLYHSAATFSNVRTLTVAALVDPTIISIKDTKGAEIAHDTTTKETTFALTGKAAAGLTVELRDKGGVVVPTISVGANGEWKHTLASQAPGAHSYTVKAKYGNLPESAPRILTVIALTTGFEDFPVSTAFELTEVGEKHASTSGLEFTVTAAGAGMRVNKVHQDRLLYLYAAARIKIINGFARSFTIRYIRIQNPGRDDIAKVVFYNLSGQSIGEKILSKIGSTPSLEYTYDAPSNSEISYIEIDNWAVVGATQYVEFRWR